LTVQNATRNAPPKAVTLRARSVTINKTAALEQA
jgi:hypothetical protein